MLLIINLLSSYPNNIRFTPVIECSRQVQKSNSWAINLERQFVDSLKWVVFFSFYLAYRMMLFIINLSLIQCLYT